MDKTKSKGWRRRWLAAKILGLDIQQFILNQGDRMETTIHQAVTDIKNAVAAYQQTVTDYDQAVTEELTRVENDLADLRVSGGGADAQDLEDLSTSLSTAKDNIAAKAKVVAAFELPAIPVASTDTTGQTAQQAAPEDNPPAAVPVQVPVETPGAASQDPSAQPAANAPEAGSNSGQ